MTIKIAKRGTVSAFVAMDVMRAANTREAAGNAVYHLEVGQPGTKAPDGVLDAVEKAMREKLLGYTDALGIPELRHRLAHHYQEVYGVSVDPQRIIVTTGSSGGFLLSFLAAFEPGDRIGICSPGYPAYRNILKALGYEVVDLLVGPDTHYQPTPAILDALDRPLEGLVVASPSNPTGSMLSAEALKDLIDYCKAAGTRLISDEIYHGITFGQKAETALSFTDDVIVVNSFSKYFSMTGWRLGWVILPEDMLRPVECLTQSFFISPPAVSQYAGLAALDQRPVLDAIVQGYARNRETLLAELPKAGFTTFAPPDGAFYLYADVGHLTDDSQEFCQRMLTETGVAATPGIDFDPTRGHRFLRFSFAGKHADMVGAAKVLREWLA